MKLKKVEINNFRSIKYGEITFEPRCRVLVGINESGKSNILDALSFLSDEYQPKPEDEREPLPNETDKYKESEVRFVFEINEKDDFYNRILSKIMGGKNTNILKKGEQNLTVRRYCESFDEGLFCINIKQNNKYSSCFEKDTSNYKLVGGWKKPQIAPNDYEFIVNEENYRLSEIALIQPKGEWNIPDDYLAPATFEDFYYAIVKEFYELMEESLPKVIYWKYSDEQLLPEKINLEDFTNDPNICIPLRNMFYLANQIPINEKIKEATDRGPDSLDNLLNRIAIHSTNYFREAWKEYENIEFSLVTDGGFIKCSVKEQNKFSFQKRSDGFKKFVAFLLTVSTRYKAGDLDNALILIDEPETGLHPSGARYLRDELIKLSKNNYVVYSTHSIFMIDRHTINRHLIITKENEITEIQEAKKENNKKDNIVKEEVIFNALNYSMFEHLKEINIILEGKYDRDLFEIATNRNHKSTFFNKLGIGHAYGVSSYRNLIPTLELAERKALIISDNDKPAKTAQKEYKKLDYKTKWKRYNEISENIEAETGEDFLKKGYLVLTLKSVSKKYKKEITLKEDDLPNSGRLKYIGGQLKRNNWKDGEIREVIQEFKEVLFDKLTKSKIEDSYKTFLSDLKAYIEKNLMNSE